MSAETKSDANLSRLAAVSAVGVAAACAVTGCTEKIGRPSEPLKTGGAVTFTFNDIPGEGNTKVLNYALFLETMEAEIYRQAELRLLDGGYDNRNQLFAGLKVGVNEPDVRFVANFHAVEGQHRDLLRTALTAFQGFQAIQPSKYDFGIANMDRRQVMEFLYSIERTGARAYLGALKYLPDDKYLRVAAAIQGTEARHYAAIAEVNNFLFGSQNSVAPLASQNHGIETPEDPDTVLASVSKFVVAR